MHSLLHRTLCLRPQPLFRLARSFARLSYKTYDSTSHHTQHYTNWPRSSSSMKINGDLIAFPDGAAPTFINHLDPGIPFFDRTGYITAIESFPSRALLFLRPPRFGKSYTLSMLQCFHGLEYKKDYAKLFEGLDIDNDVRKGTVSPNQYLVLRLDFSGVSHERELIDEMVNGAMKRFYKTYAPYFEESSPGLIDRLIIPDSSAQGLFRCTMFVRKKLWDAMKSGMKHPLAGVNGIYVLIDEYDTFANDHITAGDNRTAAARGVEHYIKDLYSIFKARSEFSKFFITGVSPVVLSHMMSGFNIERNVSFDRRLSGLCGLTREDLQAALRLLPAEKVTKNNDEVTETHIKHLTTLANGYNFCSYKTVDTVLNTDTCLQYFQGCLRHSYNNFMCSSHSEVNEAFLDLCTSVPTARNLLSQALEQETDCSHRSLKYIESPGSFQLSGLGNMEEDDSKWLAYLLYNGALTFDGKNPSKFMKIPNKIAAERIATAILNRFGVSAKGIDDALHILSRTGEVRPVLMLYQKMMSKCDLGWGDFDKTEEQHVAAIGYSIFKNILLKVQPEFMVTPNKQHGRVDMVISGENRATVIGWKTIHIDYLEIPTTRQAARGRLNKASALSKISDRMEVLKLKFSANDKLRPGKTIEEWVYGSDDESPQSQVKRYFESPEITMLARNDALQFRGNLVIIVGNRKVLCCDVDKDGKLGALALMEQYIG
ncbi:hypothetical protein BDD12DRAFT_828009 [Trichophaea hybrida]|nr:hypothetical protein BDD12DRAFT_828009 [Trichophaea hybrida]